jgi:hypothetical protein
VTETILEDQLAAFGGHRSSRADTQKAYRLAFKPDPHVEAPLVPSLSPRKRTHKEQVGTKALSGDKENVEEDEQCRRVQRRRVNKE